MKKTISVILSALTLTAAFADPQKPELFGNGEKSICFVGDSITHHGFYPKQIALFYITHFPDCEISFKNAGYEGGSAGTTLDRFGYDVKTKNADVYTLMLGMNDIRMWNFSPKNMADKKLHEANKKKHFDTYRKNMTELAKRLKAEGKLVLMSSSIYDDLGNPENPVAVLRNFEVVAIPQSQPNKFVNAELNRYGQWVKSLAEELGVGFSDNFATTNAANKMLVGENPHSSAIGRNRVHPFDLGGFFTANAFIKAMEDKPLVYNVEINADTLKANGLRAEVKNAKKTAEGLEFELVEHALPFPLTDATFAAANMAWCEFKDAQILKIAGLPEKNAYALKIDGEVVGYFSAAQLRKGVNLALNTLTPQAKQAREVERQVEIWRENTRLERDLFGTEFIMRVCEIGDVEARAAKARRKLADPKFSKSLVYSFKFYVENYKNAALFQKRAAEAIKEAYRLAKPRAHKYELAEAVRPPFAPADKKTVSFDANANTYRRADIAAAPRAVVLCENPETLSSFAEELAARGFAVAALKAGDTFEDAVAALQNFVKTQNITSPIALVGIGENCANSAVKIAAESAKRRAESAATKPLLLPEISACAGVDGGYRATSPRRFNKLFAMDAEKALAAEASFGKSTPPTLLLNVSCNGEVPATESLYLARKARAAGAFVQAKFLGETAENARVEHAAGKAAACIADFFKQNIERK